MGILNWVLHGLNGKPPFDDPVGDDNIFQDLHSMLQSKAVLSSGRIPKPSVLAYHS